MNKPTGRWKAERHDWLMGELRALIRARREQSDTPGYFSPVEDADRNARGRTGGCAIELERLINE